MKRLFPSSLCVVICLFSSLGNELWANGERQWVNIPAGAAKETLTQFARDTGLEIIYRADLLTGIETQAVSGRYTPYETVVQMLLNTGLECVLDEASGALLVTSITSSIEMDQIIPLGETNPKPNSTQPMKKRNLILELITGFLAMSVASNSGIVAQEALEDENIFVMSPFEVSTSEDVGYVATNTLAGSRLNSKLADTPAAISVFTKELLDDLAIADTFDAVEYGLNTSNDFEETTDVQTGNFLETNNIRVRLRGLPTGIQARNYFRWNLRSDSYNTERIDFSRGPNSILFGRGGASGVINTSTKQARFNDFNSVTLRIDEWDQRRVALDFNREILEGKIALRVNLLHDEHGSWQDVLDYESQRAHIAATWNVFKSDQASTRLRFEYERSETDEIRVRPWAPFNGFNLWDQNGRPTIATARDTNRPEGARNTNNNTYMVYTQNGPTGGTLADWEDMSASNSISTVDGQFIGGISITDFSILPREAAVWGPGSLLDQDYSTFSVYLEQSLFDNLNIELAYNNTSRNDFSTRPINWNSPIRVDINEQLPDGSPNPNLGELYVEDFLRASLSDSLRQIWRATAAYDLDFNKWDLGWLGRHQIAFLYQMEEEEGRSENFNEGNLTPLENQGNIRNGQNRIRRRTYLDFQSPGGTRAHLSPFDNPIAVQELTLYQNGGTPVTGTVTPGLIPQGFGRSKSEIDTILIATQNYFWNDRIVTTFGYREDEVSIYGHTDIIAENSARVGAVLDDEPTVTKGDTTTYGVVGHINSWLSVFFNQSETFDTQGTNRTIDDQLFPNLKGETEDFGVRFSVLDQRVIVTATYFDTVGANVVNLNKGNIRTAINQMIRSDALINDPAAIALDEQITDSNVRDTVDLASSGYEFELVGNITDNWRILANYSNTDSITTNRAPFTQAFVAANENIWRALPADTVTENGDSTFGEQIAIIQEGLDFETNQNGFRQFGDSKHRVNATTTYTFSEDSPLKGFSPGFSLRWRSSPPISRFINPDGTVNVEHTRDADTTVDLHLIYRRKIMDDKINWRIQLNVRNLFDDDDILPTRKDLAGNVVRYRFKDPRQVILTSTFEF